MSIDPWWTEQAAGTVGAILGSSVGVLGGVLGTLVGVCAPRGKARAIVIPLHVTLVVVGSIVFLAGLIAIVRGQGYHVFYPLLLGGGLMAIVCGPLLPVTFMSYRIAEARQSASGDADPASLAATPASSAPVMEVIAELWGEGGSYRRVVSRLWPVFLVFGLLGLGGAATAAGVSQPFEVWFPMLMIGLELVIAFAVLFLMLKVMAASARSITQIQERQRLDAESFRRGADG